jgi:acetyl-CoA carboxylase biotin carboxylase subunit
MPVRSTNKMPVSARYVATRTVLLAALSPPARATDSYLRIGTLIEAARGVGAQAIHPAYGFLSEREEFAAACEENSLIFIGPASGQIERVGNKREARCCAEQAQVPIAPVE